MLKALIAVMAVIAVSLGLLQLSPLAAQTGPSATRSLSPDSVAAGGQVMVTITAEGFGAFGQVVETLPAGFTYVSSSGLPADQVDSEDQTVTFTLLGKAPFTYIVTASNVEGDYSFMGVFSGVLGNFRRLLRDTG